jgi:hypothetical protein
MKFNNDQFQNMLAFFTTLHLFAAAIEENAFM